jgi:gliding motility-associated lipoprotein GldB
MAYRFIFYQMILFLFFCSCSQKQTGCIPDENILNTKVEISVVRLENLLFGAQTKEELLNLIEENPEFSAQYLLLDKYTSKEELALTLMDIQQDTLMQELFREVKMHFEDFSQVEQDLKDAFKHLKYYYPDFKIPQIYTFVGGFDGDLILSEDILVIGLDFFLPSNHRFQPPDLPHYISKRYQKEYIVPMVMLAISSRFNQTDLKEKTLLSEMIYYGKAYHFTKSMMPCTSDQYIIGYTEDEIAASFANEEYIWTHFIENDLLFVTNPFVIRKYTGEAPFTDEISPDAPGRLGRWVGWNIVDDYKSGSKVSLPELMADQNSDRIFRQSGYKPRI